MSLAIQSKCLEEIDELVHIVAKGGSSSYRWHMHLLLHWSGHLVSSRRWYHRVEWRRMLHVIGRHTGWRVPWHSHVSMA